MIRRLGKVRQERTLNREYFQYGVVPREWISWEFAGPEVKTAMAHSLGLSQETDHDYSALLEESANKGKIVRFLGKLAVAHVYGFPLDRIYRKKNFERYDFFHGNTRIVVKTANTLNSEVVLCREKDFHKEEFGPELMVAVNMDIKYIKMEYSREYYFQAWIVGWCLSSEGLERAAVAADISKDLVYVRIPSLNAPKSLIPYLEMKSRVRGRNTP